MEFIYKITLKKKKKRPPKSSETPPCWHSRVCDSWRCVCERYTLVIYVYQNYIHRWLVSLSECQHLYLRCLPGGWHTDSFVLCVRNLHEKSDWLSTLIQNTRNWRWYASHLVVLSCWGGREAVTALPASWVAFVCFHHLLDETVALVGRWAGWRVCIAA